MLEEVTHKIIQPTPKSGVLKGLVLCWSEHGVPFQDEIKNAHFNTNINHVNCHECLALWSVGYYGNRGRS